MSTPPKPEFWAAEHARAFFEEAVAAAYHYRPEYPECVFSALESLVIDKPRTILDLGCGPGDLARQLVHAADRVDAIDVSAAMVEQGRAMEYGDSPNLRWIVGRAEEALLDPPYALVAAGDSLQWMDWDAILRRIREMLTPNGFLAVVGRSWGTGQPEELEILKRYSTNKGFRPLNPIEELESRGLFQRRGQHGCTAAWHPTVDEYLGARRSQASFPTKTAEAEAFERETRALLEQLLGQGRLTASGGRLALTVQAGAAWGRP